MTTPDHDESKPRRRWPTYLVIALVLLLIIYPLSVGPAYVALIRCQYKGWRIVTTVYRPLFYADELICNRQAASTYIDWWFKITGTDSNLSLYDE